MLISSVTLQYRILPTVTEHALHTNGKSLSGFTPMPSSCSADDCKKQTSKKKGIKLHKFSKNPV